MNTSDIITKIVYAQRRIWFGRNLSRLSRSNYRRVWNSLAVTEDEAKRYVAGYTDEDELLRTADQVKETLIATVGIRPDDTILEIGAGIGRVGQVLAPLCKEWIGADVSSNMLKHLRHRLHDLHNTRAVLVNGHDLSPIPSESIDLVYCTVVFMHLDEWDRFGYVSEGMRVLKPGGRMFVDNFNLLSNEGWDFFMSNSRSYHPLHRPPHISKSSTPQEIRTYFERAGFHAIKQELSGLWLITYGIKQER